MKSFPKTKADNGRAVVLPKQQPYQSTKTNTFISKYRQQQEEQIADESQLYQQLGQSLVGERQFIPFNQSNGDTPIQQNISIAGTIEKVYFQNASRVNKQELMKDTKIQNQIYAFQKSSKIKRQPEVTSIKTNSSNIKMGDSIKRGNDKPKSAVPIPGGSRKNIQQQEEEQNQFLSLNNVGKWNKSSNNENKSRQPVVSEEMKKIHTHYQNRLTETKWVKRKRESESRQSEQRTIVSQNAPSLSGVSSNDPKVLQDKNKSRLSGKNGQQLSEQMKSSFKMEKQQNSNQQILNEGQEQVQQEEQQQAEVEEQEEDEDQQKQQSAQQQEQELEEQQQEQEQNQDEDEDEQEQQEDEEQEDQEQDQQQSEHEREQQGEEEQDGEQQQQMQQAQQSSCPSQNTWKTDQSPNSTIQSKNINVKKWSQSKYKPQSSSSQCQNNNNSTKPQNNSKVNEQTNKDQIQDLTEGEVQNDSIDPNWEPLEQILLRILKLVN